MREILFKAKRIDNGEWVEGLIWKKKYNTDKIFISCFPDKDDYEEVFVVDKNTICQFTGLYDNTKWEDLTDKEKQEFYDENCSEDGISIKYQHVEDVKHLWKGKKVWEHDIINHQYGDEKAAVEYGPYHSEFDTRHTAHCGFFVDWNERHILRKDLGYWIEMGAEVIGNVFDNPELIGGDT